jgi:microcystin-dependent protein
MGQLVPAATYPKLAALLGQAGGNVTIPDLRDRVPLGASATKALGSLGGEETVRLAAAQSGVPAHPHGHTFAVAAGGSHAHGYTNTYPEFFTGVNGGNQFNVSGWAPRAVASTTAAGGRMRTPSPAP